MAALMQKDNANPHSAHIAKCMKKSVRELDLSACRGPDKDCVETFG